MEKWLFILLGIIKALQFLWLVRFPRAFPVPLAATQAWCIVLLRLQCRLSRLWNIWKVTVGLAAALDPETIPTDICRLLYSLISLSSRWLETEPLVKKIEGAPPPPKPQPPDPRNLTVVWVFRQELLTLTMTKRLALLRT